MGPLRRLLALSEQGLEVFGGVLVAISLVSVVIQIVMRYGFNDANTWSDTLASASLAWIAFLSATAAVRSERNLAVRFVVLRLPPCWRKIAQSFTHLIILAFAITLTVSGSELMSLTSESNVEGFLVTATWSDIYSVSVLSGVLMALYSLEHLVLLWRKPV
jgi:TRAP-type transport system small permease protein